MTNNTQNQSNYLIHGRVSNEDNISLEITAADEDQAILAFNKQVRQIQAPNETEPEERPVYIELIVKGNFTFKSINVDVVTFADGTEMIERPAC